MEKHAYTINNYYSKNIAGQPCHTYELRDNGKLIYTMNNCIREDGSESSAAVKVFYDRAERIMDATIEKEGNENETRSN